MGPKCTRVYNDFKAESVKSTIFVDTPNVTRPKNSFRFAILNLSIAFVKILVTYMRFELVNTLAKVVVGS